MVVIPLLPIRGWKQPYIAIYLLGGDEPKVFLVADPLHCRHNNARGEIFGEPIAKPAIMVGFINLSYFSTGNIGIN